MVNHLIKQNFSNPTIKQSPKGMKKELVLFGYHIVILSHEGTNLRNPDYGR